MPERDYYTARELAEKLDFTPQSIRRAGQDGRIPGMYRVLRECRFRKQDIDAFMVNICDEERRYEPSETKRRSGRKRT